MNTDQKMKHRFVLWGLVGLAVVAAFVAAVVVSQTGDGEKPVVPQQPTPLVADDRAFCYDLTTITMAERISTPSLYSWIMPGTVGVPEEHFADDAWKIATLLPDHFTKATEQAAAYDEAVQSRCAKGGR